MKYVLITISTLLDLGSKLRVFSFLRKVVFALVVLPKLFWLSAFVLLVTVTASFFIFSQGKEMKSFAELSAGLSTPEEFVALAQQLEEKKQFEDAAESYKAAIELAPALQLASYSALARIYSEELSEKDSGLAHLYLRGLAESPRSRVLMRGLAEHYERIGENVQAFQWYQKILELYPQDRYIQLKLTELQREF